MDLYPLKLSPRPSTRLWGGSKLRSYVAEFTDLQTNEPIGEAWLVYADNEVSNGVYRGKTLQAVADDLGEALLGSSSVARYGNKVPLLAKFLDAGDKLSIQVHPDDSYALSQEAASGDLGKTEAWYILAAEPGAQIIWGFKDEVTADTVRRAVADESLEPYLNTVSVEPGDVIYNPAGTVHAVGAGLFIYEIQQSSDLTYRLYDYGRRTAEGELRELHLDKALDVADLKGGQNAKVVPAILSETVTRLVQSDFFVMEHWTVTGTLKNATQTSSLELFTVLEGSLSVTWGGETLSLGQAESVLLPALLGNYQLAGQARAVRCYLS